MKRDTIIVKSKGKGKSKRTVPKNNPSTIKMTYKGAITMEGLMTKVYGKLGTKKRDQAEKKIRESSKTYQSRIFFKSLRESQKLTQQEIASRMNTSPVVVIRLEKNVYNTSLETIISYAKALSATQINLEFKFKNKPTRRLKLNTGL